MMRKIASAGLILFVAGALVACSSTQAADQPPNSDATAEAEESVSNESTTYDDVVAAGHAPGGLVASGLPADLSCEAIGALVPDLSRDLHVQENEATKDNLFCRWTDIPLEGAKSSDVDLTISLNVQFREWWHPPLLEEMCTERRDKGLTTELGSMVFDGPYECAGGGVDGNRSTPSGDSVWAQTPYFWLDSRVTCKMSTMCRPGQIGEFSEEASLKALRNVADLVTSQLQFTKPDFVSEQRKPLDFVVDWAGAGFPGPSEEMLWFCPSWEHQPGRNLEYDWLYADATNYPGEWTITAGTHEREVVIVFPGTTYRIDLLKDMDYSRPVCIETITEG